MAVDFGEKKLGDQIKAAARHKIPYLIVLGEDELSSGSFTVRDLVSGKEQKLPKNELADLLLNLES